MKLEGQDSLCAPTEKGEHSEIRTVLSDIFLMRNLQGHFSPVLVLSRALLTGSSLLGSFCLVTLAFGLRPSGVCIPQVTLSLSQFHSGMTHRSVTDRSLSDFSFSFFFLSTPSLFLMFMHWTTKVKLFFLLYFWLCIAGSESKTCNGHFHQ